MIGILRIDTCRCVHSHFAPPVWGLGRVGGGGNFAADPAVFRKRKTLIAFPMDIVFNNLFGHKDDGQVGFRVVLGGNNLHDLVHVFFGGIERKGSD